MLQSLSGVLLDGEKLLVSIPSIYVWSINYPTLPTANCEQSPSKSSHLCSDSTIHDSATSRTAKHTEVQQTLGYSILTRVITTVTQMERMQKRPQGLPSSVVVAFCFKQIPRICQTIKRNFYYYEYQNILHFVCVCSSITCSFKKILQNMASQVGSVDARFCGLVAAWISSVTCLLIGTVNVFCVWGEEPHIRE